MYIYTYLCTKPETSIHVWYMYNMYTCTCTICIHVWYMYNIVHVHVQYVYMYMYNMYTCTCTICIHVHVGKVWFMLSIHKNCMYFS